MTQKIIFLMPHATLPRYLKRVAVLRDAGFEVDVFALNRGVHAEPNRDFFVDIYDTKNLSKRKKISSFLYMARKALRYSHKGDIIYVCEINLASVISFLTLFGRRRKFVYEIGDIDGANKSSGVLRWFYRVLERWVIRRSSLTMWTSDGFARYMYPSGKVPSKIITQPNKLNKYFKGQERPLEYNFDIEHLKFGVVSVIRDSEVLLRFMRIVGENYPQHSLHLYGDIEKNKEFLEELFAKYDNVFWYGAFKNPEDLERCFKNIDICIHSYSTIGINARIAEPNKLYEAIYFIRPLVASADTFFGTRCEELGIGEMVNFYSDEDIIGYIDGITEDRLQRQASAMRQIPSSELIDDSTKFIECIKKL